MTIMQSLPLETTALRLRHFTQADARAIKALNGEPSTRRWIPSQVYASLDEAETTMALLIRCYEQPGDPRLGPYVLAIEERTSGELLGHVGFSPLDDEVEVGYALAERARGRGLGAEALERACRWVAASFSLKRVIAVTAADNVASRRILERTGFAHVLTEPMLFQGRAQSVARYEWRAPG